jgi:hypothetical protein
MIREVTFVSERTIPQSLLANFGEMAVGEQRTRLLALSAAAVLTK